MKLKGNIQKWAAGILGTVSVILLLKLALQFGGVRAGNRRPSAAPPSSAGKGKSPAPDDLMRFDPSLRLDLVKQHEERPLPEVSRNPFEFEAPPAPPVNAPLVSPLASAQATVPPPPPPPPPIKLTPLGYSEAPGGVKEASISDADKQIYVVHEGDTVANKYRILKITPTAITVEDADSHQTAELPIPQ